MSTATGKRAAARSGRRRARLALTAAAAALAASACSSGAPPAAGHGSASPARSPGPARPAGTAVAGPTTLAAYDAQKLHWRPCHGHFQCARLAVPFDYGRPAWRRFSLPVVRLPATDPSRRIGSLVVNPGGPGASGVSYALQPSQVATPAVRARFDVVGFDPRGVAGSIPSVHCLTGPQMDRFTATSDTPTTAAQQAPIVAESRLFVRGCEQRSGLLLPYVGTPNAARDMDVLRAALGDAKLTYLGKSYGTFLGTWYAQLFPSHVRALVLDGAVDPRESAFSLNTVQAEGFQVALRSFTANCLRSGRCPLGRTGSTVAAAIGRLQQLLNRAAHRPLSSSVAGRPGNGALLLSGVVLALYSKSFWPYLRQGLAGALAGNGTVLVELADLLAERNASGQYTNLIDAETAVDCIDRPWPRQLAAWREAAAAAAKAAPLFGASNMWSSLPCAYWPVPAARPVPMHAKGAPPILVVGTTRDPATPFRWAQALARELDSGVLLGWNGDGHTAYLSGSPCVDSAVDAYLISLKLPRDGTRCP